MYYRTNRTLPYPQNLVFDVLGQELTHPPHDLEDSVEYILETQLKERDAFILILRYFRAMTIREIAAYYGLSAQRITQIIQKALRRSSAAGNAAAKRCAGISAGRSACRSALRRSQMTRSGLSWSAMVYAEHRRTAAGSGQSGRIIERGESAGIITAALPRFFVCDIHSSVLPGHPSFSPGAATAIKLSTTSSKCLYCSGVSRATFRTRIDVSSSEILPSNR